MFHVLYLLQLTLTAPDIFYILFSRFQFEYSLIRNWRTVTGGGIITFAAWKIP